MFGYLACVWECESKGLNGPFQPFLLGFTRAPANQSGSQTQSWATWAGNVSSNPQPDGVACRSREWKGERICGPICWRMLANDFPHLGSSNNFSLRFYENSFLLCPVLFDHCFPEGWPLGSQSNLLPGQPVGNALRNFSEEIGHGVSTSNGQDTDQECT